MRQVDELYKAQNSLIDLLIALDKGNQLSVTLHGQFIMTIEYDELQKELLKTNLTATIKEISAKLAELLGGKR